MTRDPEIREAGKSQVSNFGVAVNKRVRVDGEWKNGDPQFFEIQAWGFDAERSMQLNKGDAVIVVGELNFSQRENEGKKQTYIRVTARALGKQLPRVESGGFSARAESEEIPF